MMGSQRQIKGKGPLLRADGSLADVGWARQPLLDCNLEDLHFYRVSFLQPLRVKRWDYYGITTPTHFFSFTVSDVGYLGLIFADVIEFATGIMREETLTLPLARGVRLPRNSKPDAADDPCESLYANGRRRVDLNLGYGFGDTSAATENALILEGRIHKLGQVDFTSDPQHFKSPWTMHAPDGRLELTFTPFFERVAKTDALVLNSEVHQVFGRYSGTAVTDEGETVTIENVVGWAEEHHARW